MSTKLSAGAFWAYSSVRIWCCICLAAGALLAWDGRYTMNPDGLSYLDMASETARGDSPNPLGNLVNGYWSPLYPAIVGIALWLVRPSAEQEFPLVHAVNLVIFASVLLSFLFFLKASLDRRGSRRHPELGNESGAKYWLPLAFVLFLWSTTQLIPLALVSPDLCVCGCVFWVAGICSELGGSGASWRKYATLGVRFGPGILRQSCHVPDWVPSIGDSVGLASG